MARPTEPLPAVLVHPFSRATERSTSAVVLG
jgi:hypothetical protein